MEMNTAELKKGATKRCSWGLCKSHSSYPESMPWGTHFIRFVKVRKVKDEMTEWEKNLAKLAYRESEKMHAYMWQKRFCNCLWKWSN